MKRAYIRKDYVIDFFRRDANNKTGDGGLDDLSICLLEGGDENLLFGCSISTDRVTYGAEVVQYGYPYFVKGDPEDDYAGVPAECKGYVRSVNTQDQFEIKIDFTSGLSGGPVMNSAFEVIGIYRGETCTRLGGRL